MERNFAGYMRRLVAVILLLGALLTYDIGNVLPVYASTTYEGITVSEDEGTSEENAESSSDEDTSDDGEVLGVQRKESDRFILGLEIAISLTFVVGLLAAGRGVMTVEKDDKDSNNTDGGA